MRNKAGVWLAAVVLIAGLWVSGPGSSPAQAEKISSGCDTSRTTICTIEIWLGHKQKKNRKAIRQELKDRSVKVLHHTIQFWRPRGGHPPTNIAIGRGLSAEDARWVIDLALRYNDAVTMLVLQRLNPPHYAAIATSAWDENSQIPIKPEDLERLRDPRLSTEEFHKLYVSLTGEENIPEAFY